MRSNAWLTILLLLAPALGRAQTHSDSLWISPEKPRPGDRITVTFRSDNPLFTKAATVTGGLGVYPTLGHFTVSDLALKRSGDIWTATVPLADTAAAFVVFVDDTSGNHYIGLPSMLYQASGNPITESYKGMFEAYTLGPRVFGMQGDEQKADSFATLYYSRTDDSHLTYAQKFSYYGFSRDTVQIMRFLSSLPLDSTATEDDYVRASGLAAALRNNPLSELIANLQRAKYPRGNWKKNAFADDDRYTNDVEEKIAILRRYKATFPEDTSAQSYAVQNLMFNICAAYAQKGDLREALHYVPPGVRGASSAATNNYLALTASRSGGDLAIPLSLARAALDTIRSMEITGEERAPLMTSVAYKKMWEREYAQVFADNYANLLYRTGDFKRAYAIEGLALQSTNGNREVIGRYHMIMEKMEPPSKVIASLRGYIQRGLSDSAMDAQFLRLYRGLYHGKGSAGEALAALKAKAGEDEHAEMIKSILHDPAPSFTLRDLQGKSVCLDSLRGKTVVLDLWATWCGPCKASFPAMQKIVDKHKADNNVVVLFVDTWERGDDKNKNAQDFLTASPYTFHVLMDNDNEVVDKYKVSGIPTKFIIDPNGILRFKAIGFNGDTESTAKELEEMIGLAAKQ